MSFIGKNSTAFVIENFNNHPKNIGSAKKEPTLLPMDPKFSWDHNSKNRNKAHKLSYDNPFVNETYSSPLKNNNLKQPKLTVKRSSIKIQKSPSLSKNGLEMISKNDIALPMNEETGNSFGKQNKFSPDMPVPFEHKSHFESFSKAKGEREVPLDSVENFIVEKKPKPEPPKLNSWQDPSEYDDSGSMRSTKQFSNVKKKNVRLGWGTKRKRTIISAGKSTISKNMNTNNDDMNTTMNSMFAPSLYEVPTDTPLGLDLEKFLANECNVEDIEEDDSQVKLMKNLMKDNKVMLTIMNKRANNLKIVQRWWNKANLDSTINTLSSRRDTSLVVDFFNYTFVKDPSKHLSKITMENAAALLAHLYSLINSKYESYIIIGLKALKGIFDQVTLLLSEN